MENRRKRSRFVECNEVVIRTSLNKYQGTGIKGRTYDLSTGGTRILTKKAYPVGTRVRIRIDLVRTRQVVAVDGEVTWLKVKDGQELFEIGVTFRDLTSHTILTLLKHLYGDIARSPSLPA